MNPSTRFLVALQLTLATFSVVAKTPSKPVTEVVWQALLFDGVKVGHTMSERREVAGKVRTREVMAIEIRRTGEPVRLDSETIYEESSSGEPLGFSASMRASSMEMRVLGTVVDGLASIELSNAGNITHSELPFGKALLGEGQRQLLINSGLKPGQTINFQMFDPLSQQFAEVTTRVIGPSRVEVYDQNMTLIEVEQTVFLPGSPITARAFVDAQFKPYRSSLNLLGMKIEQVTCDRACALQENQPLDYLNDLMLKSPRAISAAEDRNGLRYTLARRDQQPITLLSTSEQRATAGPGHTVQLDVCANCGLATSGVEEVKAARASTAWLQSEHPEIVALASAARAGSKSDDSSDQMRALEAFVRSYIRTKNLSVGYASALETVRTRTGDCTEHALLLAALARASGIPARVMTGFAYVDQFGEGAQVFVPHAWTQAWVDGRWQSFDAALSGFGAGHIALAVGDGDPSRFYAGMNLLGEIEVRAIEALPKGQP
jgi:hypothetical protein